MIGPEVDKCKLILINTLNGEYTFFILDITLFENCSSDTREIVPASNVDQACIYFVENLNIGENKDIFLVFTF